VSKRAKYLAKAAEHSQLSETCQTDEAREIHRNLAEWFLLLADDGGVDLRQRDSSRSLPQATSLQQ
jgi:hypothetical protein